MCDKFNLNVICDLCQELLYGDLNCHRCVQCALPLDRNLLVLNEANRTSNENLFASIDTDRTKTKEFNSLTNEFRCGLCINQSPSFDQTITLTCYKQPLDQLIISLKFKKNLSVAKILGDALTTCLYQRLNSINISNYWLIPIPLGKQRLASRGYNQALEIAHVISKKTQFPLYVNLLKRSKETVPQSNLTKIDRHKNMNKAFEINKRFIRKLAIFDGTIILVDDVMTSTATMNAAAQTLKKFNAQHIIALTAFRTPK